MLKFGQNHLGFIPEDKDEKLALCVDEEESDDENGNKRARKSLIVVFAFEGYLDGHSIHVAAFDHL